MKKQPSFLIVSENADVQVPNKFLILITTIICYSGIFIFIAVDVYVTLFQHTYFRAYKIPLLKRSSFIQLDRYKLTKLTLKQRINCLYCSYANGIVDYFKAVTNHMEVHSCAIKHQHTRSTNTHQNDFYEYDDFL